MDKDEKQKGYFYILTNRRKYVLYIGSTKDLMKRVKEHRKGYQKGFTQRYEARNKQWKDLYDELIKDPSSSPSLRSGSDSG